MPVISLIGTPLSEKELKAIIGGSAGVTRTCVCTYTDSSNQVTSESVEADSEVTCSAKCHGACSSNASCISATYSYSSND